MIHLENGEILHNEKNMVVCETGDYEDGQLVLVGEINNPTYPPDFPLYQYVAYYIKYGTEPYSNSEVYSPDLSY
jgi:hypothetical protein